MKNRIGILGGTFDPIHRGHLQIARACMSTLKLNEVRFIPCQQTLLKNDAHAKPWQRAAMVALAIANEANFILDTREIERSEPSYSLLTLQSLQHDFQDTDFFLLLGDDAFHQFDQWHQWQELASLCDLVVVSRVEHARDIKGNKEIERVFNLAKHKIIHLTMPHINVASRALRSSIQAHADDLPKYVLHYILENNLYS